MDTNYLSIETYNKVANEYFKEFNNDFSDCQYIDEFLNLITGDNILDIGCGIGNLSKYVADKNYKVDAIDLSEKMLELAQKYNKHENLNYYIMDMKNITLLKKYDGIMILYSLFHLSKKNVIEFLYNIKTKLKENSKIIIILQNGEGEEIIDEPLNKDLKMYINYYKFDEIKKVLLDNNFKIIKNFNKEANSQFELGNNKTVIIAENRDEKE